MFVITGVLRILGTLLELLSASLRPRATLAAENVFLRRQLALYLDRNVKARRPDRITRFTLDYLAKSPPQAPKAICERLIGTLRRECLDWLIPLSESHLRTIFREWVAHYNRGRPHMFLGPGIPEPPQTSVAPQQSNHRMNIARVRVRAILGGLHHEYALSR